jgi:hypothetical protein
MSEWIKKLTEAYGQQQEAMDPVDKSELKGKHKDRKDKDIDNDGDVDSSDEYLHKKRKAISKAQQDEAKVDEISMTKLGKYAKAAKKDIDQKRNTVKTALDQPASVKKAKAGMKAMSGLTKRSRGADMYVNKMTGRSKVKPSMEAYEGVPKATHKGYQDPQGVGLSPSAKDQLAKKTPMPEPVDEPKVDAKNFKDFRKTLKVSKKRPGDNDKGDKNIVK